ncbi:MAG: mechanosensitive ion channel family protein [Thiohalocapsa sp.]|jgi:small-conductance mechanosensitive channel|uniref:mechanosensitive ion channel family protein n=1 Tax=Thiohalocapsa sp. TaxID=2497641 RepID=UPI0025E3BE80|nr:mechanosensitive ion channel domain-containing protein [Thiohalocapsa sp.]MCG6941248.1 mechanosensitive ion channel family protein [Thiohalocapsa sp.]
MSKQDLSSLLKNINAGVLLDLGLILAVAVGLILVVQKTLPWLANRLRGRRRHFLLAMVPLLRLVIIVGAFLWMVPIVIEPSLQNMVAVLGSLGLALGFALKDFASSLVAGVVAVGETPYRNGDWVEIDGVYGEVTRVGMRALQLMTPDDNLVTIPHLKLWTDAVSNANNGEPQLQCPTDFYLHPEHDAARVRAVLQDVALTSPYVDLERPILVVAQEQPWGTRYRLRTYPIDARQQFRFSTDLTVRGKAELLRLGLTLAMVPAVRGATLDGSGGPRVT